MASTLAIVEDDADICEHLEQVLTPTVGFRVVATCRNARTALAKIPPLAPELIIMDLNLPDGSGIDCTRRLRASLPAARIVVFTVHEDQEQIFKALEAGANGYLLKRTKVAELLAALDQIRDGGGAMSSEIAGKVIRSFHRTDATPAEVLTRREEEVVQLLAKGFLSKEIAAQLSISLATVNGHLRNIYEKFHVRTRTEAVLKYLE
jgi:DNA-binding NarL/FixJ family response regulator